MSKAEETKLTLRAPSDLIEVMHLLSDLHDRSLNGEIVRALREYAENHVNEWGHLKKRKPRNEY